MVLREPDDAVASVATIVQLGSWQGDRLGDPRRDRAGVCARLWRAIIDRTGRGDAAISTEIGNPLVTAGVVAAWRAGRCLPDLESATVLLTLAGAEGIDAIRGLTLL